METIILYRNVEGEKNIVNRELPSNKDTFSFQGEFRQVISITEPVIDLEFGTIDLTQVFKFNYCYIPRLERYYWLRRFEFVSSKICRLYLHEDYYNTWSKVIENMECQIVRSESATTTKYKDEKLPIKSDIEYEYIDAPINPFSMYQTSDSPVSFSTMTFICTFATEPFLEYADLFNSPNTLTARTYIMSEHQLINLLKETYKPNSEVTSWIKSFFNNYQDGYMSFLWFRFDLDGVFNGTFSSGRFYPVTDIHIGSLTANMKSICEDQPTVYQVGSEKYYESTPIKYDVSSYNSTFDFINYETDYELFIPYVGFTSIDIRDYPDGYVYCKFIISWFTGDAIAVLYEPYEDNINIIGNIHSIIDCVVGYNIPITRNNVTERRSELLNLGVKSIGAIIGFKANSMIGMSLATTPGTDVDSVYRYQQSQISDVASLSSNLGSSLLESLKNKIYPGKLSDGYINTFFNSKAFTRIRKVITLNTLEVEQYRKLNGLPVFKYGTLKDLKVWIGYTELGEFHLPMSYKDSDGHIWSMTEEEWSMLNGLLSNGGFIYNYIEETT